MQNRGKNNTLCKDRNLSQNRTLSCGTYQNIKKKKRKKEKKYLVWTLSLGLFSMVELVGCMKTPRWNHSRVP